MVEFHAVQCFNCSVFQVQQVKKVAKYTCRLCGAKQSVKQVCAISHKASDVRSVVTSLNARRQAADDARDADLLDEQEPACHTEEADERPIVEWDSFLEQGQLSQDDKAQHSAGQEAYVTELPERCAKRGRGGEYRGIENCAEANGHVQKKRTQGGGAARCATPGVRKALGCMPPTCSSQQHRPLHAVRFGSTRDKGSGFHQQSPLRGKIQPGHAAAHAGMQAGSTALTLDRGFSRWEEFQEVVECDGEQEVLEESVVPNQSVAHSAWHSSAAELPYDELNLFTYE